MVCALGLFEAKFEVYEARNTWTGHVKIKDKLVHERNIRHEIKNLCQLVIREIKNNGKMSHVGHINRMIRVLKAFRNHPCADKPLTYAQDLLNAKDDYTKAEHVLQSILEWGSEDVPGPNDYNLPF